MNRLAYLDPCGRLGDPVLHCLRCFGPGQFVSDDRGQNNLPKQLRKDINMADEDQVVDRPGIGYNQPHR
jgi:hypothetical protein